ncbi:NUDIX domain-containing protein [Actinoplanes utahensis]|uniref:ADP-ribose pyrophosphatase n=1 Tax=Actinoplanes utahensis TaxID=1869 RepID=A0A0A6XB58_ACTUT|nr:NUDIX hydrolase [Actinoplanes utahensis]KHD77292.1 ADP-ribose pyrophosphatase [Actinoplanes utahensis]GIF33508.1 ADP-ribose pyrophosphatase [Actinoplanes utahensis]
MTDRVGTPPPVRRLDGRTVYRNPWMTVREDRIERADGSHGIYGVVDKPDFALVIPAENDGFHLVEQYRYPVGDRCWEFPQGSWSVPAGGDRSPHALAAAELREETGLVATRIEHLGRIHVAYGYASQGCHVFLATGLESGPTRREASEADMVHRFVPAAELTEMVHDGRFRDAASLAALTLLTLAKGATR